VRDYIIMMRLVNSSLGPLVAGLERYYPFGRDDGKGAVS
jgi:hypothetical protein